MFSDIIGIYIVFNIGLAATTWQAFSFLFTYEFRHANYRVSYLHVCDIYNSQNLGITVVNHSKFVSTCIYGK